MKNPSSYLKMRILGAVENAKGKTIKERIITASKLKFTDEQGNERNFTWRTISTWYYRYKTHGITGVTLKDRHYPKDRQNHPGGYHCKDPAYVF